MINKQIFNEGDIISGFEIHKILEDEVILIKGLKRYTLYLSREAEEE